MDEGRQPACDRAAKPSTLQPQAGQADVPTLTSHMLQPECSRSNSLDGTDFTRAKMIQLRTGKEKAWAAIVHKKGPLQLLDLPMDVLKDIIKEVTHTNDLTSLALTHSALHSLAIPHIYSRFDIVWPDVHTSSDPRNGVDALTYGLATLVMREDLFSYVVPQRGPPGRSGCVQYSCNHCGMANHISQGSLRSVAQPRRPRRGNLFSQYTRKFSLGNGPSDWVQEYLITKEGGKMLGTLVALTVARMPNLETFVWDMPTGVLRDVWYALGNNPNGHTSRLEKVWVRFHDNKEVLAAENSAPASNATAPLPAANGEPTTSLPDSNIGNGTAASISPLDLSYHNTECPSFSILPPLKSLTVLEVDECAYLAEMSVLLQRSLNSLRELRVGISGSYSTAFSHIQNSSLQHPEMQYLSEGGVLGLLMSKLYDCRPQPLKQEPQGDTRDPSSSHSTTPVPATVAERLPLSALSIEEDPRLIMPASIKLPDSPIDEEYADTVARSLKGTHHASPTPSDVVVHTVAPALCLVPDVPGSGPLEDPQKRPKPDESGTSDRDIHTEVIRFINPTKGDLEQRLRLEVLELENVHLSVPVLQHSMDWSCLTSVTLLQGSGHEQLWKFLRRNYSPRWNPSSSILPPKSSSSRSTKMTLRRTTSSDFQPVVAPEYRLNLRRIHTDSVSPALVTFLKETLAPNTLEWMILQDRGKSASPVPIESIYRGPLRYHRSSLKKVSIDSSSPPKSGTRSSRWKRWQLSREILTFITSGKMGSLRELGMAVDFKDWHYFLQRLPNIPHLRSLYVPYIADHSYAHNLDAKELASQVVDLVIALRPEIELCYLGILKKCFEILENRDHEGSRFPSHDSRTNPAHSGPGGIDDSDDDTDGTDDDQDNVDDSDNNPVVPAGAPNDSEETESDGGIDSAGDSDDDAHEHGTGRCSPMFRLREILFYDDKISIFKARHGRL